MSSANNISRAWAVGVGEEEGGREGKSQRRGEGFWGELVV